MSSALEDIKARAEKAAEARRNYDEESVGEGIMLALIAEQSSYDVPPLIAALEGVEGVRDTMRQESGLWLNPEDHFARLLDEAIAAGLRAAINEALEGAE